MSETGFVADTLRHSHVLLGARHEKSERRMWAVIWLCGVMMVAEIVGGLLFGSIALVADGLHMSALLLAALAYTYARKLADDPRFTFGTGKLGDLAGFASAIILTMISILIGYEAVGRLFAPVPIQFAQAIPIAALGLAVNLASARLLSGGNHHHDHGHSHSHDYDEARRFDEEIPEPHAFSAHLHIGDEEHIAFFEEHEHAHGSAARDNNMRAAVVHVIADATVSVLVIAGLLLARVFGWLWIDPLVGIVGACVIASWSYGLIRDTGVVLLDMNPDRRMAESLRQTIEEGGDTLAELHHWRLGPGSSGRDCFGWYAGTA